MLAVGTINSEGVCVNQHMKHTGEEWFMDSRISVA